MVSEIFSASANALSIQATHSTAVAVGGGVIATTGFGAPVGATVAAGASLRAALFGTASVILNGLANAVGNITVGEVLSP